MFGSRGSKAVGSIINNFRGKFISQFGFVGGAAWFITISSGISLGLVGIWFFVAVFVGKTFNKAIKEKKVVC